MREVSVIVEEHEDGFVAYPVGLRGVVVAEGDTFDEAMNGVKSAIEFHLDTFGAESLEGDLRRVTLRSLPIAA